MVGALVLFARALAAVCRRRRGAATMYVTSRPGIELEQRYGGWNAEAYDAGTGRGAPLPRSAWTNGPPSTWARYL